MKSIRQNKIERLLQKELSEIFRTHSEQFVNKKIIMVTKVKVPDLNLARVYLSIFPSKNLADDIQAINQQTKAIRYLLGQQIKSQFRLIPELLFFADDSIDYLEKIENLLN